MELSMIGSVIVGLTIFELLYWLFSVIVENWKVEETLDQEAVDYLIRSSSKNQNAARPTKEKKED